MKCCITQHFIRVYTNCLNNNDHSNFIWRGGGGTLIFPYIHRLGPFLGWLKLRISIFLGVFKKMNIFWGMKICGYYFGVITIGLVLGVISMHFRAFPEVEVQIGGYFLGLLQCQIFFWCA